MGINSSRLIRSESSSSITMCEDTVKTLFLNDGEHQDGTVYRLKKGWTLDLRVGPTLFGRKITVYCNIPAGDAQFFRNQYRALTWEGAAHDDTARYCRVHLGNSGSFHYYFIYDDSETKAGSGYILVDPELSIGGSNLPLDCVQCVTYLSKCLGPFSAWEKKLQVAKETGYNMIHFTPIQELGGSNSAYSLRNQLELNTTFHEGDNKVDFNKITQFTDLLRNEWKILSICDVVLNHTANETPWLKQHPESTYNLINSPHLKPAYLLDVTLFKLSLEVAKGDWEFSGIPAEVNCEAHLNAIRHALLGTLLPKIKIPELYMLDVSYYVTEFQNLARSRVPPLPSKSSSNPPLKLIPDPQFRRLKATVDMEQALRLYNVYRSDCFDEDTRLRKCTEDFKQCLEQLNGEVYHQVQGHLVSAVDNCIAGIRYFRVQSDGPRIPIVSEKEPLMPRYFTDYENELNEDIMHKPEACYIMAHNGWVMNADPLHNFAASDSNVYLRRELIAWGDSVKLRYGDKPEDSPFLWEHMQKYVEETAKAFDGIRLDNCHSTPLIVAEYLMDAARRVRPNLYVVAELFTNSDFKDNIFVNRLGITSLIREAMSAWDSHEQGRLVYRYGGLPVGAFCYRPERPLAPSIAHALFLDLTHDNECPIDKRSVFDSLPSSGLVAMACCASGSNMGYDQLVPHHIHVVNENRQYPSWGENGITLDTGIVAGKKALNNLHYQLGKKGYNQVFVDQVDKDIVCITRHCEATRETVVLIAFTAFQHPTDDHVAVGKGVTVSGTVESIIIEAGLSHISGPKFSRPENYVRDKDVINGLSEYKLYLKENFKPSEVTTLDLISTSDGGTRLNFTSQFHPGCVVAVKVVPQPNVKPALQKLSQIPDLSHVISKLTLVDLNRALYCCGREDAAYDIPGFGPMVYCGLQGVVSILNDIAAKNDLGHPLCNNLRNGHWLCDYLSGRLQKHTGTKQFGDCLQTLFAPLKDIPRYLVPSYFERIVIRVHNDLINQAYHNMSQFVKDGSLFVKMLALGSVQCGGIVQSAPLPPLSKSLAPPQPLIILNQKGKEEQACVTLAAGLPHFSVEYMRNWGRDTFISLRGLFLLTGRFQEARYIILAYAGCLRHGLIPNLLDGGNNPRYNCRDAVWWWFYTIQSYVQLAPNGLDILKDKVNRIFPTDDVLHTYVDQDLVDVMQEALNIHFQGLCFRERNAGTKIDAHMTSRGFDNQIGIHPKTGFIFGGNEWNCGTWMDKMGSSDIAGNRGRPATPRDGSAVELIGLSKATVRWLTALHQSGHYPYNGVTRTNKDGSKTTWTFAEWDARIQASFEENFWVPTTLDPNEPKNNLVHRRGIYKDSFGATQPWADYQLRCNFPIAIVVAPELFTPTNGWQALKVVEECLLGPLGMRTLDPEDWAYNGFYNNDNNTADAKVAHGFNYHQGPEWVWPMGFFLRARLILAKSVGGHSLLAKTMAQTRSFLSHHFKHLEGSVWKGLPELTNKDGTFCPASCPTQAWSMGCILEVLEEMSNLELKSETN
ncbi:glycogen debranching enzyme isoform X2 [Lycorma delicatula]|uniref:glycogen debranching enzyme isoform X2 n=1 Tax=Lycorma delicatula TaxID=130591 RepID=UPI003F510D7D